MMLLLLALGAFAAVAGAFLAGRFAGDAVAREVRARILPYLRRRAADAQLEVRPEDPRQNALAGVREACNLAEKLQEREKHEVELSNTLQMQQPDPRR